MVCSTESARAFLDQHRLAVIGASDDPKQFGYAVYKALKTHGYDVVPVNPNAATVLGDTAAPDIGAVPGPVDGAVVMVNRAAAVDVVRQCIAAGVPRVWLFKGIGAPGAVSDEAVRLCQEAGVEVVAGACPLMFLEPVGFGHKLHRWMRRANGSLSKAA